MRTTLLSTITLALALVACGGETAQTTSATADKSAPAKTNATTAKPKPTDSAATTTTGSAKPEEPKKASEAVIGKPAPEFKLKDLDGKEVSLSSFKGKTVVIEWFNPECPFIQKSHTKGGLVESPKKATDKGVVWLSINSGAAGKQGAGVEKNKEGASKLKVPGSILLDETGEIGRKYGATNTPHMFIVDKAGVLVYAGAVDNSPDAESGNPEGGKLINYVDQALGEIDAGKPVSVPETKAYGCSVKYGSS